MFFYLNSNNFAQVLTASTFFVFIDVSTSTLFIYVELVSLKSILTYLICVISTALSTDSLNSADVSLNNKQTKHTFTIYTQSRYAKLHCCFKI